jgi:hypothetical protein
MCGGWVSQLKFECGHVIPVSKGGENTLENLRPVCNQCNKSMGTTNLFEYVNSIGVNPNDLYLGGTYSPMPLYQRPMSEVVLGLAEVAMTDAVSSLMRRSLSSSSSPSLPVPAAGKHTSSFFGLEIFQGGPDLTTPRKDSESNKQIVPYKPRVGWVWPAVTSAGSGVWWGLKTAWWLMGKAARLVTPSSKKHK